MPASNGQVPPQEALNFTLGSEPGSYNAGIPASFCIGAVVHGGMAMSLVQKVAIHFVSNSPKTPRNCHVRYVSITFLRPTFPSPAVVALHVRIVGSSRKSLTVHVELEQNDKLCLAGYLTFTDLSAKGDISLTTGWKLDPPTVPVTLDALKTDNDPRWVSYVIPSKADTVLKAPTYLRYYLPVQQHNANVIDQWVTPAWNDDSLPDGPVWTNDLLHFVIDVTLPILTRMTRVSDDSSTFYDGMIRERVAQRKARSEGREEAVVTEGTTVLELLTHTQTSVAISTEIKKWLPESGVKWLFVRIAAKQLVDDRMDSEVIVMDEVGDLVAISQHVLHIVKIAHKQSRKRAVL